MDKIKNTVIKEYDDGNIIVAGIDGLMTMKLEKFINQDIESMLYDLNRTESVILTFIEDPKWVNDYAVCKVIRALKNNIDKLKKSMTNEQG